jgi:hypothetical protein
LRPLAVAGDGECFAIRVFGAGARKALSCYLTKPSLKPKSSWARDASDAAAGAKAHARVTMAELHLRIMRPLTGHPAVRQVTNGAKASFGNPPRFIEDSARLYQSRTPEVAKACSTGC